MPEPKTSGAGRQGTGTRPFQGRGGGLFKKAYEERTLAQIGCMALRHLSAGLDVSNLSDQRRHLRFHGDDIPLRVMGGLGSSALAWLLHLQGSFPGVRAALQSSTKSSTALSLTHQPLSGNT